MSNGNISIDLEVVQNTAMEIAGPVEDYAAEQARIYAESAAENANKARDSQNMAEAWAESEAPPAGETTRSARTWSDVARQWAESETEPDGVEGAASAKTWADAASASATSATAAAGRADQSAQSAVSSASASADSAAAAAGSAIAADNSETSARQSAAAAAAKLEQMQVDLAVKADADNAVLTGVPTVPTPAAGAADNQIANVAFVLAKIAELVSGSPAALDTLNELAAALGNDPNFATTIMTAIGSKLGKEENAVSATKALQDGAGNVITTTYATKGEVNGVGGSLAAVARSGSYTDLLDKPTIPAVTSQLTNDSRFISADADGNVAISGTLTATRVFNAIYNDYAEFFPRGGATVRGDIIALDEAAATEAYVKATEASKCIVGVQSEEFAQIIGGDPAPEGKNYVSFNMLNYIPVALAGRVHVRFMGQAIAGMKVVPSIMPGVGRAFTDGDDPMKVIGQIVVGDRYQNVRLVKIKVGG